MFEVKVASTDKDCKAYVVVDLGGDVQLLGPSEHSDGHKTVVFKYVSPLEMRQAAAMLLEEADRMTDVYRTELRTELAKLGAGETPYNLPIEGYPGAARDAGFGL